MSRTVRCMVGMGALLLLAAAVWGISGRITSNTTWSGNVDVDGDIWVEAGVLTIEPGTKIAIADTDLANLWVDTTSISILIRDAGMIQAVGTEANPITFTSAAATPAKGDWNGIYTRYITNDDQILFKYCVVEYANTAFNSGGWSDSLSWVEPSAMTIENCTMRHLSGVGIYASSDAVMKCYYSTIHDCDGIIFWHGIKNGDIKYLTAYDASHGLVFPGAVNAVGGNVITIDHLTLYNIDLTRTTNSVWWTGYGIYQCNDPGTLTMTNSILVQSTLANVKCANNWNLTFNYNCYHTGLLGFLNLEGCTAGPNDLETDPLLADIAAYDFRLTTASPCLNTASDGTNRGANQETPVSINDNLTQVLGKGIRTAVLYEGNTTEMEITLEMPQTVTVASYTTDGRMNTIIDKVPYKAGIHLVPLDNLTTSGMYVVACRIAGKTAYHKVAILQ